MFVLLSFIVDLKLTEDNQVQILEFGPMQHAGFSGYKHVTGKDMREDIVYPFFEENWHGHVIHIDNPATSLLQTVRESLSVSMATKDWSDDTLLVRPFGYFVNGRDIYGSSYVRGYEYMNGSSSFMMMNQNKAYFDFMAARFGSELSILPKQTTLTRRFSKDDVEKTVMQKVPATEYVIKTPDTAQGRGTMVVKRDDVESVVKAICRKSERGNSALPLSNTWDHAVPLITVQEKVQSRPTEHNGKNYDGTMRVAMTVWRDKSGALQHEIHDAYWKMPRNAIGEGDYQDQVISCSPHYDRLTDTFLKHSSPPETFAPVSDADKQIVFGQLARELPEFVANVADLDTRRDVVLPLLGSDKERDTALAAMTYADMHYDGFAPSKDKSDKIQMDFHGESLMSKLGSVTLHEIPRPMLDLTIAHQFRAHCREKPRGPVAAFFSALHKRTTLTNGYAVENMGSLARDVRQLRRPACSYAPIVKITILDPKEFVCDVKVLEDNAPKI
jgi:hypothetical protein